MRDSSGLLPPLTPLSVLGLVGESISCSLWYRVARNGRWGRKRAENLEHAASDADDVHSQPGGKRAVVKSLHDVVVDDVP